MSKRLEKMRRNPKAGFTIADVEAVCRETGLTMTKPSNGSHYKIAAPGVAKILTVPFKRPIKPIYIKKLVALIDEVMR